MPVRSSRQWDCRNCEIVHAGKDRRGAEVDQPAGLSGLKHKIIPGVISPNRLKSRGWYHAKRIPEPKALRTVGGPQNSPA
jgi:hypothetical protein